MAKGNEPPQWNPPVGEEAVRKATGRGWDEWLATLDEAGAADLEHREIVAIASAAGAAPWWAQSVTVGYERARGLRDLHQKPDGYSVSVSRTVDAPVDAVFSAWTDEAVRDRWLPEAPFTIRKATPSRSVRITWMDGTRLDVGLNEKGERKSQVALEHRNLPDREAVDRQRVFWRDALDRLKSQVEG